MRPSSVLTCLLLAVPLVAGCGVDRGAGGPMDAAPEAASAGEAADSSPDLRPSSDGEDAASSHARPPVVAGDHDGGPEPDAVSRLGPGGDGDPQGVGLAVPEDLTLDLVDRHPGGTVLRLDRLSFEGNTILVTGEFFNGATGDVWVQLAGDSRLRLLDDRGTTYNLVVPDGLGTRLELPQGESVGGDFAFLGPLDPQATRLTLVANALDGELPLEVDFLSDLDRAPQFAVEGLDLRW